MCDANAHGTKHLTTNVLSFFTQLVFLVLLSEGSGMLGQAEEASFFLDNYAGAVLAARAVTSPNTSMLWAGQQM